MITQEAARDFNNAIERAWQDHMQKYRAEYEKDLCAQGITDPQKREEFFAELKRDVQLVTIEQFKEKLQARLSSRESTGENSMQLSKPK